LTWILSWNEVAETTWITFAFANAILADSPPAEKAANEHAQHEILYCCNIARNGQVLDMLRNDNLRICACLVQYILANRTKIESWIYTGVLNTILKLEERPECHSGLAESLKI